MLEIKKFFSLDDKLKKFFSMSDKLKEGMDEKLKKAKLMLKNALENLKQNKFLKSVFSGADAETKNEEPEKNIAEPILEPVESPEDIEKKKKREVVFELALFLILGILLGITIKTEAVKRITIGFNDYKIANGQNGYNLEEIKKVLEQKATTAQDMQQSAGAQTQQ
ncbi:MAG TPA: hypothetical protein PK333_03840 [Candidatus Moranbacteria bacterium]|nr:hypothetical protein [Candidatus Moranbacteria bacterium]